MKVTVTNKNITKIINKARKSLGKLERGNPAKCQICEKEGYLFIYGNKQRYLCIKHLKLELRK